MQEASSESLSIFNKLYIQIHINYIICRKLTEEFNFLLKTGEKCCLEVYNQYKQKYNGHLNMECTEKREIRLQILKTIKRNVIVTEILLESKRA